MKRLLVLPLLFLAGCVAVPENISAVPVPSSTYAGKTCDQLLTDWRRVQQDYAQQAWKQNRARSSDAAGVALLGLPVGRMSKNNVTKELAVTKGHRDAINDQMAAQKCPAPPAYRGEL